MGRPRTDEIAGKAGGVGGSAQAPDAAQGSRRLGQLLVEDGVLTWEELERALARQRGLRDGGTSWTLGEVVVAMRLATVAEVQRAISRQVREDHLDHRS